MRKSIKIAIIGYSTLLGLMIVLPIGFLLLIIGVGALVGVVALLGLVLK